MCPCILPFAPFGRGKLKEVEKCAPSSSCSAETQTQVCWIAEALFFARIGVVSKSKKAGDGRYGQASKPCLEGSSKESSCCYLILKEKKNTQSHSVSQHGERETEVVPPLGESVFFSVALKVQLRVSQWPFLPHAPEQFLGNSRNELQATGLVRLLLTETQFRALCILRVGKRFFLRRAFHEGFRPLGDAVMGTCYFSSPFLTKLSQLSYFVGL